MQTHRAWLLPECLIHKAADRGAIAVMEDPFVRKYLRDVLVRHGYRVVGASADRIVELLRSGDEKIDLIATNSPADFLAFADSVPLLYMAAAPDRELASLFPACRVLKKPFRPEQLLTAVGDLIGPV